MNSIFDSIAVRSLPESVFDLSHEVKLSGNMGELLPIFLEEVIPGDTFEVSSEVLMRLAPMLAPIMHRVNVFVHYFYVPNRLVWDEWNDHITGGEDGLSNPAFPYISIGESNRTEYEKGSLADYLGVPVTDDWGTIQETKNISALPFRGYQTIYNEYFRDQDLSTKVDVSKESGGDPNGVEMRKLRQRSWQRDYFTSARPSAQKGPQVVLPNSEVVYKATSELKDASGNPLADSDLTSKVFGTLYGGNPDDPARIENIESISAATVEDTRVANRMQEWLELAQRGGSRINEVIKNFFGENADDLRLQRPQYLGGGVQNIIMSEVLNTAGSQGGPTDPALQPLGEYGGHGISMGRSNKFRKKFKEHGYVHGILSVLPKTAYQQGLHKHWTKFDKYEKYWPQFANVGEQEIKNKEIFFNGDLNNVLDETFGYAPRYSEYKYACDRVAGEFRKLGVNDNLSYWHMGRYFDTRPALNKQFVESDPTHRIFAVTDEDVDKLYIQVYHKFKAKRKMPYHNIPSNMPV